VVQHLHEIKFDGIEFVGAFTPHYRPEDYANRAKRMEIKKLLTDHTVNIKREGREVL
jgi:hypothetical protein